MKTSNIAQTLAQVAQQDPEGLGLVASSGQGYRTWTFKAIDETSSAFAHGLSAHGVEKGDRVVLMVGPSLEFVCLTFALFRLGAVVILIDPGMGYKNLLRCIGSVAPEVFIGVPRAHLFRRLNPGVFRTVRTNVCVGRGFGIGGASLAALADFQKGRFAAIETASEDLAAIIFTTGSTGPPKGVRYEHGMFFAQLELIRDYYGIGPGQIDQPAFPLFALFSTALGACAVLPDMNPAEPAKVDPAKFIRTILDRKVTYSFGSPAIWNVVSRYCLDRKIVLPSLKKVLMAGAPVPGALIERVKAIMPPDAEVHTPYGATECLPIASITGSEILEKTWQQTRSGRGTCVGRPLPGITIKILPIADEPIAEWDSALVLPAGQIGEIVVQGGVVTRSYDHNDGENRLAKIKDKNTFWHRLGDVGYLDEEGRLWFCGRKAHRVVTLENTMFTIPCEAIFNEHPEVFRSALVGVGARPEQTPVLVVERHARTGNADRLIAELRDIAHAHALTRPIKYFLVHPAFPVDIRHNAKIFREKLAVWASKRI